MAKVQRHYGLKLKRCSSSHQPAVLLKGQGCLERLEGQSLGCRLSSFIHNVSLLTVLRIGPREKGPLLYVSRGMTDTFLFDYTDTLQVLCHRRPRINRVPSRSTHFQSLRFQSPVKLKRDHQGQTQPSEHVQKRRRQERLGQQLRENLRQLMRQMRQMVRHWRRNGRPLRKFSAVCSIRICKFVRS